MRKSTEIVGQIQARKLLMRVGRACMLGIFLQDTRGAAFVEKAILTALAALALIFGVSRLSGSVKQVFDASGRNVAQNLNGSPAALALGSLPKAASAAN